MKAAPFLALGAAAALAYYAWSASAPAAAVGTADDAHVAAAPATAPAKPPPAIAPQASSSSGELDLATLKGQTVVLNFWAPWCPPCRAEIPTFAAYAEAHPEVAVIGIGVDAGPVSKLPQTAARFGITYPVYPSTDALARAFRVSALPTTVVLDGEGQVVHKHTGMMSPEQLSAAVAEAH